MVISSSLNVPYAILLSMKSHQSLPDRFTEIDLLRFLSALAVAFFHYTFHGFYPFTPSVSDWFPRLSAIAKYGFLGFHLFFIISGFVILMTALGKTPRQFVISRVVRLYPAYWFCCTLSFILILMLGRGIFSVSFPQWALNMTMLQGFFKVPNIDGVYWTLFIEIKFYLFIFLLIVFRQIRRIHVYLGIWLALSAVSACHPIHKLDALIIPEFSAYFIAGAAFFLIYKEGIDVYKTLLLLGSLLLALYRGWEYAILASEQFLTVFKPGIILGCICLFYLIFLFIALRKTSFIRSRFFIFLGSLTYPFYLIHQDLGLIIFKLEHAFFDPHVLLGVTLILMLMVTWLIHSKIEKQYSPELKKALEKNLDFSWLRFKLNRLAFSTNDIDKPAP